MLAENSNDLSIVMLSCERGSPAIMKHKVGKIALWGSVAMGLLLLVWGISTSIRAKGTGFQDKSLYDWLDLLIVPAVLAAGAWLLQRADREAQDRATDQKDKAERALADQRAQIERQMAFDRAAEDKLQAYLGQMTELLLENGLRISSPESEVRIVARARTLTTLRQLDGLRKGSLLSFLQEARLIEQGPSFATTNSVVSLQGADLRGIVLLQANLTGADLRATDLREGDLRYCRMTAANLERADLRGALLQRVSLTRARLRSADFSAADMSGANLEWADLPRMDLPSADLTKPYDGLPDHDTLLHPIQFVRTNLTDATLSEAYLRDAKFVEANLSNAFLTTADLGRADFTGAQLRGTDLRGAYLSRANLSKADLTSSSLCQAYLGAADFSDADLSRADLRGANLHPDRKDATRSVEFWQRWRGVKKVVGERDLALWSDSESMQELHLGMHLQDASLDRTNLREANLTDAKVSDEQLTLASSLQGATMSDGTKHE
jgi:uncharacterized protein YjbI with pentapeptide repeats